MLEAGGGGDGAQSLVLEVGVGVDTGKQVIIHIEAKTLGWCVYRGDSLVLFNSKLTQMYTIRLLLIASFVCVN